MKIPTAVTDLAGFTMAHALWNLCDIPDGELLCPLAFTTDSAGRKLLRFEADSQEEAIENAYATLEAAAGLKGWAFAREGTLTLGEGPSDVLIVEAWGEGLDEPMTFVQPYRPFSSGAFCLLGPPVVIINQQAMQEAESRVATDALRSGVVSHEKAASLWSSWSGW